MSRFLQSARSLVNLASTSAAPRLAPSLPCTPSPLLRSISTSSPLFSWGGGKLKTHQGAAKRFKPISKKRNRRTSPIVVMDEAGIQHLVRPGGNRAESRPGPLFKRGQTGKRHLNLMVSGSRLNSLGGTQVAGKGRTGWHLRKLLAPIT